jgi:AcrR family transcriptional regulator
LHIFGNAVLAAEAFSDHRLPPGRHGLSPELVAESQRWRLLGAVADELAESGHVRTTSTRVARRAGVSPATLYVHYENVGACLLAAYEAAAGCIVEIVDRSCNEPQVEWSRRLADAVRQVLRFLAAEPALANLLGAEAPAGEPQIAKARERLVDRLAQHLAVGRRERPPEAAVLPPGTERHLVAAALALLSDRAAAEGAEGLPGLTGELTRMLAGPYLGDRAASDQWVIASAGIGRPK